MSTTTPGWLQTTTCPSCGAPAEVAARHVLASTDGPVEHARIQCVRHHRFNLPVAMLAAPDPVGPDPAVRATGPRARPRATSTRPGPA